MADVVGAVLRLGHGANRHGFDHVFGRASACCLEQLPQRRLRVGGLNLRHFETELGNKLPQLLQLLGIRLDRGSDTPPCASPLRAFAFGGSGLGEVAAHPHIRQQHEVFDEAIGIEHALDHHPQRLARLVQLKFDLFRVEVDAARP